MTHAFNKLAFPEIQIIFNEVLESNCGLYWLNIAISIINFTKQNFFLVEVYHFWFRSKYFIKKTITFFPYCFFSFGRVFSTKLRFFSFNPILGGFLFLL